MNSYFENIKSGFTTAFEGMSVTFATMFARRLTVQYPETDISNDKTIAESYKGPLMGMSDNYRGVLAVDLSICTACTICMKACPIECIFIDSVKCDKLKLVDADGNDVNNRFTQKQALKTRTSIRFDINAGKCMYCGLCVSACPTEAIRHTKRFEMNTDNLEDLVLRFVSAEEKEKAENKAKELEAEAEAKKAANAAKEKEQKEKEEKENKAQKEGAKE
ncbi:4Fe-4S binding protein [bacterium]|nr:4Fe-4S binding protein [bacterium]